MLTYDHIDRHYSITCLCSQETTLADILDAGGNLPLAHPDCPDNCFLRTVYYNSQLTVKEDHPGIYRFSDWMPVHRFLKGSSAPVTYKSSGLARELGLSNLFITFSGFWPEKGVRMMTGTFKECEAYSVCARMPIDFPSTLVVASAGNTARAFIKVCSENNIPLIVVVPENGLDSLWQHAPVGPCVRIIAAAGEADYYDAIFLSGLVTQLTGCVPEGCAKNVARRDGMATTMLSATTFIGRIPDHYFQAVGSGTGAIAAWEANQRFVLDGRYGDNLTRLHLSQNSPFALLCDSWNAGTRELVSYPEAEARKRIDQIYAKVLANRKPPYSIKGGVYDALQATKGVMYACTNEEAFKAAKIFAECEGNDLSPAAAIACASLIKAVDEKQVSLNDTIMLNVTGGGIERLKQLKGFHVPGNITRLPKKDWDLDVLKHIIQNGT